MTQNKVTLDSRVAAVTVYTDRAQVTRSVTIHCDKGEHQCVFENLPDTIEQKSIQVNGQGGAILRDVAFRQVYFSDIADGTAQQLQLEAQTVSDNISEVDDKISQIKKEKKFVDAITESLTSNTEKSTINQLDPEKWISMVEFYRAKLSDLDQQQREAHYTKRDLDNEHKKLLQQIQAVGRQGKMRNQVEIVIDCIAEGEQSIELSYIVSGAQWQPFYDLRVSGETRRMELSYNGVIHQNTSESWDDVDIKLSTAQANVDGQQPELSPWRVNEYRPPAVSDSRGIRLKRSKSQPSEPLMQQMMPPPAPVADGEAWGNDVLCGEAMAGGAPMAAPVSTVETKTSSVVFNISGKNTIPNDNNAHKVTILIEDFSAAFRYSCVPKLSPYAYLKARVKNTTPYPFLAGETNIFMDNHFVASAHMELVAPSETFWTYLGIDESMKVEHKFIKRHKNEAGMFSKVVSYNYQYQFEITNNKSATEEIVVWDQLPIAGHEKIDVKLLEPEYKQDSERLKLNEYRYIEWLFTPAAGEKLVIPFKFSVEHPVDMQIEGLE